MRASAASAVLACVNVAVVPRIATPAGWKAVLCGRAFPSDWYPCLPHSPSLGPSEHAPLSKQSHPIAGARGARSCPNLVLLADARGESSPVGQSCVFVPLPGSGWSSRCDGANCRGSISSKAWPTRCLLVCHR